jgi:hypothetical protein
MPHSPLLLFLPKKFETAELFTQIIGSGTEVVEEVIVEVVHPAAFQLFGENILIISACFEIVGRHLVRERETFPRIPLDDSFSAGVFSTLGMIRPAGLEVGIARFHEFIDESIQKFLIDGFRIVGLVSGRRSVPNPSFLILAPGKNRRQKTIGFSAPPGVMSSFVPS